MSRRKALLVVTTTAALAVPAAIVLAGGNGFLVAGDADLFQTTEHDVQEQTNSTEWKPIPGTGLFQTSDAQTLTLSADMRQGRAKIRLYNTLTETPVPPGPVLFSSKASNSFSFAVGSNCPSLHELQWKRAGNEKAVAAKISVQRVVDSGPCI